MLEALACGLPFIASNVSGISNVDSIVSKGILFDPKRKNEIIAAIRAVLSLSHVKDLLHPDYDLKNVVTKYETTCYGI
jgi:glycosyltransferase involved in cell wall biosynthesis